MTRSKFSVTALGGLWLVSSLAVVPEVSAQTLVYQPPQRGAPSGQARVGGGTRGAEGRTFALSVLVPDHVGLTAVGQPTLYWFASEPITSPTEVTVIREDQVDPVLELRLEPPLSAGIQAVSLAKQGVELQPDVPYQWFVALVVDPERRSDDIVTGGEVQRSALPAGLEAELRAAGERDVPLVYARAGYWYDALDGLSSLIERSPGDSSLKELRSSLLDQVGLAEAAAFTRKN